MKKYTILVVLVIGMMTQGRGQVGVDSVRLIKSVDSLLTICKGLVKDKKYAEALPLFSTAREWTRQLWGIENDKYIGIINNLGQLHKTLGHYKDALLFFQESTPLIKNKFGAKSDAYAANLNELAGMYFYMGQYKESQKFYLEAIKINEGKRKSNPDFAINLNNLGNLYEEMENYKEAEIVLLESMNLLDSLVGKKDSRYMTPIYNLGSLYSRWGQYSKAIQYAQLAKNLRASVSTENYDYAASLNSIGNLYKDMGRYDTAISYLSKSLALMEKLHGRKHWYYSIVLENIGIVYNRMGQYDWAESLLLSARSIKDSTIGRIHPSYADNLSSIAQMYGEMGRYHESEALLLESKNITEKILGFENNTVARHLNNLGYLYHLMDSLQRADSCYQVALTIREKAIGTNNPSYATLLNNRAKVLRLMGKYDLAEELFNKVINIREKMLGREHPHFALTLRDFGVLFQEIGRFDAAEQKLLEAINIFKKVGSKDHDYSETWQDLAVLYAKSEKHKQATQAFLEANGLTIGFLDRATRYLSERELSKYIKKFEKEKDVSLSYLFDYKDEKMASVCFDNSLFYKGFLLNAAVKIRNIANLDTFTARTFEQLAICGASLAKLYVQTSSSDNNILIADLENQSNTLEKQLARTVAGYSDAFKEVKWQDIQAKLQPKEAAIEFVQFKKRFPNPTDSVFYAALIIRPNWQQPEFVPLFEEKALTELLNYKSPSIQSNEGISRLYSKLYNLLLRPLESHLVGVKTLIFSPAGQLHLVNFGAISISKDSILAQKYQLIQVGSTRQLMSRDSVFAQKIAPTAILFGGVQFNMDTLAIMEANKKLDPIPVFTPQYSSGFGRSRSADSTTSEFRDIPHTSIEVQNIRPILQNGGMTVQTLSGSAASEEAFKRIGLTPTPPRVLHLATHGFFYPKPDRSAFDRQERHKLDPVFIMSDHPMIRSGLVLAGGNYIWKNRKPATLNLEDGILTAYEISQTNLRGIELVVLSACETGLGDLDNEGVYGLQRAFKIAGVRYLIMSLWKVDDQATQEFMTLFYQKWLSDQLLLRDAFQATQAEMRIKYADKPWYWAAWILVE